MNRISRNQFLEALSPLRQAMTQEQYRRLSDALLSMPEHNFEQLIAEAIHMAAEGGPVSRAEYFDALEGLRKENGVTAENSALNGCPVCFLSEEANQKLLRNISLSAPSDHIFMTGKDDDAVCAISQARKTVDKENLPSDLLLGGKVAISDCILTVDEREKYPLYGRICNYRVTIFPDYKERTKKAGDALVNVGAMIIEVPGTDGRILFPLYVCRGFEVILVGEIGWENLTAMQRESMQRGMSHQKMISGAWEFLETWHGIQTALQDPYLKPLFNHPEIERIYCSDFGRNAVYMNRHVIRAEDIEKALREEEKDLRKGGIMP